MLKLSSNVSDVFPKVLKLSSEVSEFKPLPQLSATDSTTAYPAPPPPSVSHSAPTMRGLHSFTFQLNLSRV